MSLFSVKFNGSIPTGSVVQSSHFGANALHVVNLDGSVDFAPSEGFSEAISELQINYLRYPGGHVENTLNIFRLDNGQLRAEVCAFMDWARDTSSAGAEKRITFVLPTKTDFSFQEIEAAVYLLMRDYGGIIDAFEIGNEYSIGRPDETGDWDRGTHPEDNNTDFLPAQTEAQYSTAADTVILATQNAIERSNIELGNDFAPKLLVQMSDPSGGGSAYKGTGDYSTANEEIINGLSDDARAAVDGVVAHYYYNEQHSDSYAFDSKWQETRRLQERFEDFQHHFGRDLAIYVTEWNVKAANYGNLGAASGSTLLEMFEFMVQLGVDDSHVWPLQHKTSNALAGTREATDFELSYSGAVFSLMAESLRPQVSETGDVDALQSLVTDWTGHEGELEINMFTSDYRQVIFIGSRTTEAIDLDFDLSFLSADASVVEIAHVTIDQSTSDGLSDFADAAGANRNRRRFIDEEELTLLQTLPFFDEDDPNHVLLDDRGEYRTYLPAFQTIIPLVEDPRTIEDYYFSGEADAKPLIARSQPDPGFSLLSKTLMPFDILQIVVDQSARQEGTASNERLVGGVGRDTILARDGNDTVFGGESSDLLKGGWGADLIRGGRGPDTVVGGFGEDIAFGEGGRDSIEGNQGNDELSGGPGEDSILGGEGADSLFGGEGDDELWGGHGDDLIYGGVGPDVLDGGHGNDQLFGEAGPEWINGDDGFDTISSGPGVDTVLGGDGRDLVYLRQGDDIFFDTAQGGELGRDTVFGGFGNDTIQGGNGDDLFYGEAGNDLINGRLGADLIFGGTGFDTISSGDGADTVHGGNGRDLVFLNQGNDLFIDTGQAGPLGNDTVWTGLGDDTVQGGNGADVFYGEAGNDVIFGRLGNDTVYGGSNFDVIDTGAGNDLAFGGLGRDTVVLGDGNDRFVDTDQTGTLGQDTITGGLGEDVFVFGAAPSADTITDFQTGSDLLELAGALTAGRDAVQIAADGQVTAEGVLLDFGGGNAILLQGLTSTAGLENDILIV